MATFFDAPKSDASSKRSLWTEWEVLLSGGLGKLWYDDPNCDIDETFRLHLLNIGKKHLADLDFS